MEPITVVLYLVGAVVALIIWYFLIKAAVRNGTVEALAEHDKKLEERRVKRETAAAAGDVPPAKPDEVW